MDANRPMLNALAFVARKRRPRGRVKTQVSRTRIDPVLPRNGGTRKNRWGG